MNETEQRLVKEFNLKATTIDGIVQELKERLVTLTKNTRTLYLQLQEANDNLARLSFMSEQSKTIRAPF